MHKQPKRLLACISALVVCLACALPTAALEPEDITAVTAALIDADTGQVLFDKEMNTQRAPASITKVMTGLLTLENCEIDEIVTVSSEAVALPYGTSHIALSPGEEISVDDALYALMLPSANDAANALAEHVADTQETFAGLMTQRAKELGAENTIFKNPSGLSDDEHLTTAYDMALITRAAIQNSNFLRYFGAQRHTIPPTNLQTEERPLTNQMYMLLPDQTWCYNPNVIGGKVGYTDEARHTMTSAAKKDGRTLIAVVMGCGADQKFDDTQLLFDYGFDAFTQTTLPDELITPAAVPVTEDGEVIGEITFSLPETQTILLPNDMDTSAINVQYDLPQTVEYGSEADATVTLTVDGSPELMLELPLESEVKLASILISPSVLAENADFSLAVWPLPTWTLALLTIPLIAIAWALICRWQVYRRAAHRRAKQRRILREQTAQMRQRRIERQQAAMQSIETEKDI